MFQIIEGSKNAISLLKPILTTYVEAIVNVNWLKGDLKVQNSYKSFVVELLISHNNYTKIVYSKLISYLIPDGKNKYILLNVEYSMYFITNQMMLWITGYWDVHHLN